MNNNHERLERLLKDQDVPEAPANLLERIKNDIPADLPATATTSAPAARPWWTWRVAASLFVLLGVGLLIFRTGARYEMAEQRSEALPAAVPESVQSQPFESKVGDEVAAVPETQLLTGRGKEEDVRATKGRRDVEMSSQTDAQRFEAPPPPRVPIAAPHAANEASAVAEAPAVTQQAVTAPPASRRVEGGVEGGVVGGVIGGVREDSATRRQKQSRALSAADSVAMPPPPPVMAPATPPPPPPAPSTGGTAEPNAEAFGDVFFRHAGVNPFVDTEDDPVSTFALDVDTASYTVARRYLTEGHLPPAAAIRPEEFLNYFDYRDAPPSRGDFAVHAEGAESLFPPGPRYATIRFGIRARDLKRTSRSPAVLTFLIDTSGSMARQNRLELVKRALNLLIDELREDDEIGLVVFNNDAEMILEPTGDHDAIRRAIGRLTPSGSTNVGAGLRLAYEVASEARRREANNRVVLLSDGVANTGLTDAPSMLRQIEQMKNRGILLNTIGVGMGNYNDVLLEQLADRGNGTYAYIDDVEEAHRVFVQNLTGTLQTIAEDARVQVQFNPDVVASYRLIGYENRDVPDDRFRDDTTDAGEIGAGHTVTALYEIKLKPELRRGNTVATLTLRYRPAGGGPFREMTHAVRVGDIARGWDSAPASFQLATVVAAFAEMLKETYWAKSIRPGELVERTETVAARYGGDSNVAELLRLVRIAASLKSPAQNED